MELEDIQREKSSTVNSAGIISHSQVKLNEKLLTTLAESKSRSNSKRKKEVAESKAADGRRSRLGEFFKKASEFVESPLEAEEEDEEGEEKAVKKMEFNEVVEEMAQYYIKEDGYSNFYVKQFFETVCIHLIYFIFGPLIMPLLFKKFGRNFMRNMGLWGKKVGASHRVQIFYWVTFIITLIITIVILCNSEGESQMYFNSQYVFLSPAYISQIMVLIRYLTVCVKYGFFPPEYYLKWKTTRLTRTEVKSNYLLQGWIKPSLLVLDVYVREIFQKFNIDPNNFKLQCVGRLPEHMNNSLVEVDRIINEDARRIRQSIFRRFKKESKFYSVITEVIKAHKKKKELEKNEDIKDSMINSNNNFNSVEGNSPDILNVDCSVNINVTDVNLNSEPKISLAKEKLRNFVLNKILPEVRNKIKAKTNSIEVKVKYKNEYLYEINGIYLCRTLLKDVFTVSFESYAVVHKILVLIICLFPICFGYIYYSVFNSYILISNLHLNNSTVNGNSTSIANITANATSTENINSKLISFNLFSIFLFIFSSIAILPPVWLNTLNLLYGVVDIRRKKKLMENITYLIDTNLTEEKRNYPLLNVMHGNTMLNWYYLRNIFFSLGKRFGDRIILQTSVFCLFVLISIICAILSLLNFFGNNFLTMVRIIIFNLLVCWNVFHFLCDNKLYDYIQDDLVRSRF